MRFELKRRCRSFSSQRAQLASGKRIWQFAGKSREITRFSLLLNAQIQNLVGPENGRL
jgi:hypothetical protein